MCRPTAARIDSSSMSRTTGMRRASGCRWGSFVKSPSLSVSRISRSAPIIWVTSVARWSLPPSVPFQADLLGGHRVVLVDDRDDPPGEQGEKRVPRVYVPLPVLEILVGEKQLRNVAPVLLERPLVGPHQGGLPHGGGRLLERHRTGASAIPSFFLPAAIAPEVTTTKETPDSDHAEESCAASARMVGSRSPFSGSVTVPLPSLTTTRRIPGNREAGLPAFRGRSFRRHASPSSSVPASRRAGARSPPRWPRR